MGFEQDIDKLKQDSLERAHLRYGNDLFKEIRDDEIRLLKRVDKKLSEPQHPHEADIQEHEKVQTQQALKQLDIHGAVDRMFKKMLDQSLPYFFTAGSFAGNDFSFGGSVSINTWTHVSFNRVSGTTTCYLDGTATANQDNFATWFNVAEFLTIGAAPGISAGREFHGSMDEITISKGTALRTGNFTPPTVPSTGSVQNMSLISEPVTASISDPDFGRFLFVMKENVPITLNTDLKVSYRKEGASAYALATITKGRSYNASEGKFIYTTGDIDLTGQTTGDQMQYKIESFNNKLFEIHETSQQWR